MNLMQMSFSGAVMILVIVVLRALTLNKLPKKTFFVLWGVVAARLLVPYSFPSAFSVYSVLGRLAITEKTVNGSSAVSNLPVALTQNVMPAIDTVAAYTSAAVDPWVIVWAAGALICVVFFAAAYLKCRREFRLSLPVDNEYVKIWLSEHRIYRTIEIRRSDRISAPLTYGVFRPVILMPKTTDWNDLETLKYVLAHEYVHIRRFDAVSKLMLTVVLCVHWFNPAVWLMYVLANRDMELSCDEAVIRRFGKHTKSAYAMTLIRMEETKSMLNPLCNNFSKNAIEERIVAIMKMKKTSLAALIVATTLVAGVTTVFATSAKDGGNIPRGKSDYVSDAPDVEWWTYDEYKTWLENEKMELQGLIGEKCWTGSRGEFVWTQEIVDETIAMYEDILENIKNGMLYSKTIDGEEDSLVLSSGSAAGEAGTAVSDAILAETAVSEVTFAGTAISEVILAGTVDVENPIAEISVAERDAMAPGTDFAEIFEKYAPFGITYEEAEGSSGRGNVYYNGQLVSQFSDLTPDGGAFTFSSAEQGDFAVKTVYDEDGRLIGVESVDD